MKSLRDAKNNIALISKTNHNFSLCWWKKRKRYELNGYANSSFGIPHLLAKIV